jgi:DNA-binding winged helix-turn-helix (wHTH) protein
MKKMMPPIRADRYRFGDFALDASSHQLTHAGRPVAIQPKPFDLLLYLIRHRDRVVSREELLSELWRGVHVDDVAVRFTLHVVRRAVGDDGKRQLIIRTAQRAGFQFVAPVQEIAGRNPDRGTHFEPRSPTPGSGRTSNEFESLLEGMARGESRILLVSGAADDGKVRALERLADIADALGLRVLQGRCAESTGTPTFWPWVASAVDAGELRFSDRVTSCAPEAGVRVGVAGS